MWFFNCDEKGSNRYGCEQVQSSNIDIISGATYASQSCAQSLESTLQQAHMG